MADRDDRGTSSYSPYLLVRTVMRILAADGCKMIRITAENSRQSVNAACDPLRARGITPDREEP